MPRCWKCGNGGLFFRLDGNGLCAECVDKKQREEKEWKKRKAFGLAEANLKVVQDVHFKYIAEIKRYSGRAIQGKDPDLTEHVYQICLDDISLIPQYSSLARSYKKLWKEIYHEDVRVSNFDMAFEIMAFIERKRNNSEKSIAICRQAIENGSDRKRFEELIEVFSKPYKPRIIHAAYAEYWNQ